MHRRSGLRAIITTLLELAGLALVAVGVGMWSVSAGIVVAGAALVAVGVLQS